jgi:hypothetical protein
VLKITYNALGPSGLANMYGNVGVPSGLVNSDATMLA